MMPNIGKINHVEEFLVLRVNRQHTITHVIYHNKREYKFRKQILGKTFEHVGLEQDIYEQCIAHLNMAFANLEQEVFQKQIGNKHYEVTYVPEERDKEKLETALVIVRDITARKQIKEELVRSQAKFKMAGKLAQVGYFEWDEASGYVYWSDQQYRNYGYAPNEVTPTAEFFFSRLYPDDWNVIQEVLAKRDEKMQIESYYRIIRKDGSIGWLYGRINKVTQEGEGSTRLFGITQDITDQKRAEERIHRVEKELAFTNELYSRSAYLNRLLFNDYSIEQIVKALMEFGVETQVPHCCFVVQLLENTAGTENITKSMISPPIVRKQAVLIWLAEQGWGLVWRCHENIVMLAPVSDTIVSEKKNQIEFADYMAAEIKKVFPHFYVKIGLSGLSDIPVNFCELYEKANRAVVISGSMDDSSSVHYDDIGIYEVAFQLMQNKNTWIMVEKTIGRLAEYDNVRGSNLLLTLDCILEHGSLKTVSQKLFIHHNTVIWRKRKIEIILEMHLDKMETKMLLLLYLKIWNLRKSI